MNYKLKELCNLNSVYGYQNYLHIRKLPNKLYDEITIYYKDGKIFKFINKTSINEEVDNG